MPLPLEEVALKDLVKHPKLFLLYAALLGLGWVTNRLLPDDCHQEVSRWQSLYYVSERKRDSVQSSKDLLMQSFIEQKQISRQEKLKDDSIFYHLNNRAKKVLKNHRHDQLP
jgi:hypothetical protein